MGAVPDILCLSLDFFLPHRHQCGLEVHVGRLRESIHLPLSEQRHPFLMSTIYLWACFLSRPGALSEHESLYLSRALNAVGDAMTNRSRVVDFVQGSCLLSLYFLSNGRMLEGSYHASAAASMALQWGLHQLGDVPQPTQMDRDPEFRLDPAKDAIERGERVLAFWQVFNLDRCWSVVLQRPPTIPDSKHPWTSLITPWPQCMEEYETVSRAFVRSSVWVFSFSYGFRASLISTQRHPPSRRFSFSNPQYQMG